MKKNKVSFPRITLSRGFVLKTALAVCILSGCLYLLHSLMRLDYFRIRQVVVREGAVVLKDRSADFNFLVGKNIFSIDLKRYARSVAAVNPVYRKARMIRYLPDTIGVDLLKRTVLAVIDENRKLCIDAQLVVFEDDSAIPQRAPVIGGFNRNGPCSRPGYKCAMPEIVFAANVIKQSRPLPLARVNVADSMTAELFLLDGLQIKIGADDLAGKLRFLNNLISQMGREISKVEYIDLRFKEPVIKFKQNS